MLIFYADENVDGPIVEGLRRRGVDILTVQQDGRAGLKPDSLVLDRATELGRVLISQDDDLIAEANKRQRTGQDFWGVIFAPKDRSQWVRYIEDLEMIALTSLEADEYRLRVCYLPL